jgi:hypothetical protein
MKHTHKVIDIDTGKTICMLPLENGGQLPTYRAMIAPINEAAEQVCFINYCVPVNGIHAPFCTGHEKRAEHIHEYLNSIYCSICGQSEF